MFTREALPALGWTTTNNLSSSRRYNIQHLIIQVDEPCPVADLVFTFGRKEGTSKLLCTGKNMPKRSGKNNELSVASSSASAAGAASQKITSLEEKAREINLVLSQPTVDLWKLRELCLTEGGLVHGKLSVLSYLVP